MQEVAQVFGNVNAPPGVSQYGNLTEGGPTYFITNILRFLIVIAGVYALINMVLAGYAFLSAGDDPKKVAGAWAKIWQSILGVVISAGAFVLAALFGRLLFGDYSAFLRLRVFGPN